MSVDKGDGESKSSSSLDTELFTRFFRMHMKVIPGPYLSLDTSRMTLLYFCVSALDVLGTLEASIDAEERRAIIDWVYAQQVAVRPSDQVPELRCGFRGGPFFVSETSDLSEAHIAMTYTALCVLCVLGDDLSRVDRAAVLGALKHLQRDDGSFSSTVSGTESDPRFCFCACAIAHILGDDACASFDRERTIAYLTACQAYDGGIALQPGLESHGGSTFTAVASLSMLGALESLRDREGLLRWCVFNQGSGFKGRPNKPCDTCYSWWTGGTLALLGAYDMTAREANRAFNMTCTSRRGGFGKHPDAHPDLLHSYFGLAGLSLMGTDGLAELDLQTCITKRAAAVFKK